jgi:FdhD protein
MPKSIESRLVSVHGAVHAPREDRLAVEDPLEVRAQGPGQEPVRIAVTMRTPGDDTELAVGFLYGEGLVAGRDELGRPAVRELAVEGSPGNIVTVRTTQPFDTTRLARNFYATSSCGICGKAAIEHIDANAPAIGGSFRVAKSVLLSLPDKLRAAQTVFRDTGGLHATGAFDAAGQLLVSREDVGRHNAMDKVIGRLLLDGRVPFSDGLFLVSGRASFELVQKAAMAGVPVLCAVSAPSSLAVQTAERIGMTLVGFLRGDAFNIYTAAERIDLAG